MATNPAARSTRELKKTLLEMDQPTMAYYQPEHKTSPAEYGWIYQGCNVQSRVQFWVSPDGSTKMDYYPTTGDHTREA